MLVSGRSFLTPHELFYGVAFQEHRLFQGTEELPVGHGVFDGAKVKLGIDPDAELRVITIADGHGYSHQVAAVIKGAPGSVISGEKEKRIRTVQNIGRINDGRLLDGDVFLGGYDSKFLVKHLDFAVEVLQGRDDCLEHLVPVVRIKYTCLRRANFDLTLL